MNFTPQQRQRLVYELGLSAKGLRETQVICRHCRTPREVDAVIDGMARTLQHRPSAHVRQLTEAEATAREPLPFSDAEIRSAVKEGIGASVRKGLHRITGRVE